MRMMDVKAFCAACCLLFTVSTRADPGDFSVFEKVHDFNSSPASTGRIPTGGLVQAADGWFYGTTTWGGDHDAGTVFRMSPSGIVETMYSFQWSSTDGGVPISGLTIGPDGHLYGVTSSGGSTQCGTLYRVRSDGVYEHRYSFKSSKTGCTPVGRLLLASDGKLYGTTSGPPTGGTLFRYQPTTNTVVTIANIGGGPSGQLTQGSDGLLYGTQYVGGTGAGAVFSIRRDGGKFKVLKAFSGGVDGAYPQAGVAEGLDGRFYGTTGGGGNEGRGTIFRVSKKRVFEVIYSAADDAGQRDFQDGELLRLAGGIFYGVSWAGGDVDNRYGTVFKLDPVTLAVVKVHSFDCVNGCSPSGVLTIGIDQKLYGSAMAGGSGGALGDGVAFRLSPELPLGVIGDR